MKILSTYHLHLLIVLLFSLPYLLSFYLQGICDFTPSKAALYLIPLSLPQLLMGPLGGFLADYFGAKKILLIGNSIILISILILTLQLKQFYPILFIITLLVISIGNALAWPSLSKAVFSSIPKEQSGAFSGLFYTLYNIGRALTQPLSIFSMQFVLPETVLSKIITGNHYASYNGLEVFATKSLQLAFWSVFLFFCLSMIFSVLVQSQRITSPIHDQK
ncbi:MFS transporter [Acerihabitans sp. KWT182]|uniref:MFS transporter n=1 Tax=Acerihabitans sp. KWT182 TaxID=3157919 RepID=A0AAU7QBH4_9GAMM